MYRASCRSQRILQNMRTPVKQERPSVSAAGPVPPAAQLSMGWSFDSKSSNTVCWGSVPYLLYPALPEFGLV